MSDNFLSFYNASWFDMFSLKFLPKYFGFPPARALSALAIALAAIITIPAKPAQALACAAIANGSWNVTTTWSCGVVPGIGDSVTIGTPFTVTLAGNESALNVAINNGGTLSLASFTLTLSSASTGMTVNNGGILNAGTGVVTDDAVGVPFTLASGGTLQTANTQGITTGVALTGSIQTRGVRTYSSGANYVYNGTSNQAVGNGLTQNIPANVTINNPGNTVSLGVATTISGNLILTAGTLDLAAKATTVGSIQGAGNVTSNLAGAVTLTTGSNNTSTVYSGVISNGSGTVALTKVGTGALTLNGNNTYSGTTTLSAGTININSATALGSGTFTISGGTINNTSGAAITLSNNNPMNWNGNFTFTGSNALNLGTGAVTLNANRTVTANASTLTVGGVISGAFRLTKAGNGTLTLNAANTFSGTTLTAGRINIGNAQALGNVVSAINLNGGTIDNTSGAALTLLNYPYTVGGNFTFAGTNNLNLGAGVVTLTGNRTITITANTLMIDGIIGGAFRLTKAGNGALTLNAANTHSGSTLTAGTLNIGNAQAPGNTASAFIINGGSINNTSGAALTLANYPYTIGGNFTFVGTNNLNMGSGAVSLTANRTITVTANTLTIDGIIGGAFRLTKAGNGTLTLNAANTHTGTTLTAGRLNIGNAQALGVATGTFIVNGGTIDNSTGAALTLLNYPQTWGGNFTFAGTNNLDMGSGAVTLTAARTLTTTANSLTVSGVIGGGFRLTKAGAGTLTLSGANTFSGTTLSAGVLNINNAQALGAVGSAFIITAGTIDNTSGAALTTLSYPQNWNGNFTFTGTNSLNMGTGAVAMNANRTVTVNGNTLTVGGVISGAARRLTKAGAGTLTLSGANTFTGGVTLTAGTLNINNSQALGTAAGTFIINSGTIDNTSGAAITTLNYPQTWGGNFVFTGTNNLNLGTGAVTLSASRTVTVNANTLTIGGTVSPNTTDLTKTGAGTLSFGSNAVSLRSLTISAGTLVSTSGTMNLAGNFTNNSVFTHNNGTVNFNGAAAQSINGAATFNNLTLNNTNGLTINANETASGVLTLSNGRINTGVNILIVDTNGSITGAAATRYVNGFLQKNFIAAIGQSFSFPIGNAANYTPIDVSGLSIATGGGIIASTTTGEHPNIATSGINSTRDVNRHWTLAPAGGLVLTPSYNAIFNFVAGDVDGGAVTGNFIVQRYNSGWTSPTTGTANSTNTQATNIAGLGSFAIGESGKSNSTTAVNCVPNPATVFTGTTCTATVTRSGGSNTPGGTVTWSTGGAGSYTPANTCVLSGSGASATCSITYTPSAVGSGSHLITASYGGDSNFNISSGNQTITVDPKTITVTADSGQTKVYGDPDPLSFTYTSDPLQPGDTFSGSLSRAAGENVASYAITSGSLTAGPNYTITMPPVNFDITTRPITVTADPGQTKVYGDADPAYAYQITSGSLAFFDSFSGALTRDPGENTGPYAINQGSLTLGTNYNLSFIGNDFSITARPITVTADAQSKDYGDADPSLSYQITSGSLAFFDSFSGTLSRDPGETIGLYAITQDTLTLNGNYTLSFVGANLTIGQRQITVTADAQTKDYGDADPSFTYQITNGSLAFFDGFTGSLARDPGESVGMYPIKQGTLALNGNYNLTFNASNLTIGLRAVTVTADAKSKTFGDPDPAWTYQITTGSLVPGDSFTGTLTRSPGEDAGSYPITQNTLALNGNYALNFIGNNFTINTATLHVQADDQTINFGDPDPASFIFTYSGFIGTDDETDLTTLPTCTVSGAHTSAGTYPIVCSGGTDNNYAFNYIDGTLTVQQATLTVTGDNQLISVGDPDPSPFTFTYSGFIGPDDATDLTTEPICAVFTTHASPGSYSIICAGGVDDNYSFNYVNGTLVVNGAPSIPAGGISTNAGILTDFQILTSGINQITVTFSEDVYDDPTDSVGYNDDATNPANYLLVRDNLNDGIQTTSCAIGIATPSDIGISINSASYDNNGGSGPFVSTLTINNGLPLSNGQYRLLVCGSTSIGDALDPDLSLAGDGVNSGTDFIINFRIAIPGNNSNGGNGRQSNLAFSNNNGNLLIPVTGFTPNTTTVLPAQPAWSAYSTENELEIEIPSLGIKLPIVGVQLNKSGWNIKWLGNNAGYLEGSAYPTWNGNSVITGHVTDVNGKPGPFAYLNELKKNDLVIIHFEGQQYIYQIREDFLVNDSNIQAVFKHEEYQWITLVTCETYSEKLEKFLYRRLIRAVLISVIPEK